MQYERMLKYVLENGEYRKDRTGVGTYSVFGYHTSFKLTKDTIPVVTTKRIHLKSVIYELLWFLRGDTDIKYLTENGVTIWDEWASDDGYVGHLYGKQWTAWDKYECTDSGCRVSTINQIQQAIDTIKTDPTSRRIIVSAWNVSDLDKMNLPPCHILFQLYVHNDRRLSLQLYQRSADVFLGVPFNITSYCLLLHMIAKVTDTIPHKFIYTIGDLHLYANHIHQAQTQLSRIPYPYPTIYLPKKDSIFQYTYSDITISNYKHHPAIPAPVAV